MRLIKVVVLVCFPLGLPMVLKPRIRAASFLASTDGNHSQQKSTASIRSVVTHFGSAYLLMRSAKQGRMSGNKKPAAAGFFYHRFSLRNKEINRFHYASSSLVCFTTFSVVKPNSLNSSPAGADSPKLVIPMMRPPKTTYLYQKSAIPLQSRYA